MFCGCKPSSHQLVALPVIAASVAIVFSATRGAALDTVPPSHPGLRFFGYYNVIDSRYGNFAEETFSYTDLVVADPDSNALYAQSRGDMGDDRNRTRSRRDIIAELVRV